MKSSKKALTFTASESDLPQVCGNNVFIKTSRFQTVPVTFYSSLLVLLSRTLSGKFEWLFRFWTLPVRKWFFCAGNQLHGRARTLRVNMFSPLRGDLLRAVPWLTLRWKLQILSYFYSFQSFQSIFGLYMMKQYVVKLWNTSFTGFTGFYVFDVTTL